MANFALFSDFDLYSRALIESRDVDPVYPFVKDTLKLFGFDPEWFCFAYVTFYSLSSAMRFCKMFPEPDQYNSKIFLQMREEQEIHHMGPERRGTQRTPANQDLMLRTFIRARYDWGIDFSSNQSFRKSISDNIPFYGGWATFKLAEIFEKALDYDSVGVKDLGLEGRDVNSNDGPIGGLRWLYGRDIEFENWIIPYWNRMGENLAKGWGCNIGEVETCLCKFHKLKTGHYYVGHDIDELNELRRDWGGTAFDEIMSNNFDERFWKGVKGIRKNFKNVYKEKGIILNNDFGSKYTKVNVLDIILKTP